MRFRRLSPSWNKTLSFAAIHLAIAITLGWMLTGSFVLAGLIACIEPALNTLVHHRLDAFWERLPARWQTGRHALAKTAVFGVNHFVIAVVLGWLLTGSLALAGAYAFIEPALNSIAYYLFEKWWSRRQQSGENETLAVV